MYYPIDWIIGDKVFYLDRHLEKLVLDRHHKKVGEPVIVGCEEHDLKGIIEEMYPEYSDGLFQANAYLATEIQEGYKVQFYYLEMLDKVTL